MLVSHVNRYRVCTKQNLHILLKCCNLNNVPTLHFVLNLEELLNKRSNV